ncbi:MULTISPECIES: TRAP transporter large permease [Virgibacillus]|jgi:tripartite ATP-independent transporter DctM subunit|uniref:ABC transporter permease n=1 Tax=Virgibacillus halodenitrificans TaxID=1482 RepID=A0AAC9J1J5_VIRHA|nr:MULTISPECIES: TRAP transporter large permease [Virgibacillus]APC49397.1 ABC transporter permease [Virgibacillus halodenitrificans]MCG1030226.1 TRAP transporter large permease [Virgibacillus halodenitrificans]MCJ0929968.1 TRAP transporter large permease [Virgibacillus halodenitrificans]MEC2158246.1 TRAP transporter large permease [Virgibacillus halodenitrificans]MYL47707.1 TRAP transporter large permease subunit [Virgibacillus halodenitrificans]
MSAVAILIGWLVLLFLGMPVGFTLIIAALVYFATNDWNMAYFSAAKLIDSIDTFSLLAVPFFILTGSLMNSSGITERIFNFAKSFVGHFTGGLGHVNIMASLLFSGMSGSALADAGGIGQLEIKSMRDEKYDDDYAGGLTAASAIIGPIIPPSIPLIIYGVVSDQSIASLFLAGVIPGLIMTASLMVMAYFLAKKRGYQKAEKASGKERFNYFKKSFWALLTPVIIIGGIFSGFFTPTEAAVIATLYAMFLGFFVYKELTLKKFFINVVDSMRLTGIAVLMIIGVEFFGQMIAIEQIPIQVADFFLNVTSNPILLLLLINVLLIFLGMFIESLALLILLIPILVPVVVSAGIDPVHFGIIVILNLMIGILTPPMGMALFVVSKVGNIPMHVITRGVIPFLIPLAVTLLLLTLFPQLVLFLPNLLNP